MRQISVLATLAIVPLAFARSVWLSCRCDPQRAIPFCAGGSVPGALPRSAVAFGGIPATDGLRPYPRGSVRLWSGPSFLRLVRTTFCALRVRHLLRGPSPGARPLRRGGPGCRYRGRGPAPSALAAVAARRDRAPAIPPGLFARAVCALSRSVPLAPPAVPSFAILSAAHFLRSCLLRSGSVGSLRGTPVPPLAVRFAASGPAASTPGGVSRRKRRLFFASPPGVIVLACCARCALCGLSACA